MASDCKVGFGTRLKAFCCSICPVCAAARRWPSSGFARKVRVKEKDCPCCRAYAKVHGTGAQAETPDEPPKGGA